MNETVLLQEMFRRYGFLPAHQESVMQYLSLLGKRDPATELHSIRVAHYSGRIGEHCGIDGIQPKPLVWSGLLHDVGKALVDPDLFAKVGEWTEDNYRRMEPHVECGWRLVRGIHEFSAHILVRHHRHGRRPYPAELPPLPAWLQEKEELIDLYGRLLALADFYDALMTRDNENFGKAPGKGKRDIYLSENRDQEALILKLEQAGVFVFSA